MLTTNRQKVETQKFWDCNPCGSSISWGAAKSLRYDCTDTYLLKYLVEDYFAQKQVLEVGCGQGIDASEIIRYCDRYVGIDLSENSIKTAHRELNNLCEINKSFLFVKNDAENLSFPDNTFDLVYSIGVLHHTVNFESAVEEIDRVLKSGGTLLLMLYRSYTPIWVILRIIRGLLKIPMLGPYLKCKILDKLRNKKYNASNELQGTALLELVGCPIINTYSMRDLIRLFEGRFIIDSYSYYRVGFDQMVRFLPRLLRQTWPQERVMNIDEKLSRFFGFYLVVTGRKL